MKQARRVEHSGEEAARGRAREALNLALDRIGPRLATPEEAIELVRLAREAFAFGSMFESPATVPRIARVPP